jgi:cardiolipin synthase
MSSVNILVTGPELIRDGTRGIEPVVEELIREAQSEIQIMAYVITPHARRLISLLEEAAKRRVAIIIVINRFEAQEEIVKQRLRDLCACSENVRVLNFSDPGHRELHAKILVADRKKAVIGSANFSWGGMSANCEVGIQVEGEPAWTLGKIVDAFAVHATAIAN